MTNERGTLGTSRGATKFALGGDWDARKRLARWALFGGALSLALIVGLVSPGFSSGSPRSKVSIITGSVSECGGGPFNGLPRTFVVTLHERPGGHVIATYAVQPSVHLSYYAFAVNPGIYYLSTNEANSPWRHGNVIVRANSKGIIEKTIATLCQ